MDFFFALAPTKKTLHLKPSGFVFLVAVCLQVTFFQEVPLENLPMIIKVSMKNMGLLPSLDLVQITS